LPFAAFEIWYTAFSSRQGEDLTWQRDVPFHVPAMLSLVVCCALQLMTTASIKSIGSVCFMMHEN
jgi:hypothetical protein